MWFDSCWNHSRYSHLLVWHHIIDISIEAGNPLCYFNIFEFWFIPSVLWGYSDSVHLTITSGSSQETPCGIIEPWSLYYIPLAFFKYLTYFKVMIILFWKHFIFVFFQHVLLVLGHPHTEKYSFYIG